MATKSKKAKAKSSARRKGGIDLKRARIVLNTKIWKSKATPRVAGTNAAKRTASGYALVKKNARLTAKDVIKKSDIRSDDIRYDADHGFIKLVSAA